MYKRNVLIILQEEILAYFKGEIDETSAIDKSLFAMLKKRKSERKPSNNEITEKKIKKDHK